MKQVFTANNTLIILICSMLSSAFVATALIVLNIFANLSIRGDEFIHYTFSGLLVGLAVSSAALFVLFLRSKNHRKITQKIPDKTEKVSRSGKQEDLENELDFEIPEFDPEEDDDSNLGFLSDSDETATKLDLARAYIDMGDADGAKDILDEIMEEGDDSESNDENLGANKAIQATPKGRA